MSEETYARLVKRADGRPLGMAVERLLDETEPKAKPAKRGEPTYRLSETLGHEFAPTKGNALRCEICGHRKADH